MLPVEEILSPLKNSLVKGDVLLAAPPGAGKSTRVPLALLDAPFLRNKKIVMLQPRRIAARSIAHYLSAELGEQVGQSVGYRIRGETRVSENTRLEIVTEGVLTRMIQSQPDLESIGLVVFDEFHERNLHADFSLALCLEIQQALRDDLRLLVMSATLNMEDMSQLLPSAAQLTSQGRQYPVHMHYCPDASKRDLVEKMASLIKRAIDEQTGSILVFLPGKREILSLANRLAQIDIPVYPLFSELEKKQQDLAISPTSNGQRKIVLATNIAETSLTIEGIGAVVDSGEERVAFFDPQKGMTRLQTQRISRASAEQRAGRAGRLQAGHCYRLWSAEEHGRMRAHREIPILNEDITPLWLEAKIWGAEFHELHLLNQPSVAQVDYARRTLHYQRAIDDEGKVTLFGKKMHGFATSPVLASMLLNALAMSAEHAAMACAIAAIIEQGDPQRSMGSLTLSERLRFLQINPKHAMWKFIRRWQSQLGVQHAHHWPFEDAGVLLAFAHPGWIGKQREKGMFTLSGGGGGWMPADDELSSCPFIVAADLVWIPGQADARIWLAEPISLTQLDAHFSLKKQIVCDWDESSETIRAKQHQIIGALTLRSKSLPRPESEQIRQLWRERITQRGLAGLGLTERDWQWLYRVRLAARYNIDEAFKQFDEPSLIADIDQWLLPYLDDEIRWKGLQNLDFSQLWQDRLDWDTQQKLQTLCPSSIVVPTGHKRPLRYGEDDKVVLAVKMQEMYGAQDTPTLLRGKLNIVIELLSPAGRPLQTTSDLSGFWQGSYLQVQKEMKGRYPKHYWPDNPATAQATTKTKKRMS